MTSNNAEAMKANSPQQSSLIAERQTETIELVKIATILDKDLKEERKQGLNSSSYDSSSSDSVRMPKRPGVFSNRNRGFSESVTVHNEIPTPFRSLKQSQPSNMPDSIRLKDSNLSLMTSSNFGPDSKVFQSVGFLERAIYCCDRT